MGAALLAALLVSAHAQAARPHVPETMPPWLTVVDGDDLPQGVDAFYEDQMRRRLQANGVPPGAPPQADAASVFRHDLREHFEPDGRLAGEWRFVEPDAGQPRPTRAVRIEFAGQDRYGVTARVYCDIDDGACDALRAQARAMPAPAPSLMREAPGYAQWQAIVRAEPCTHGPASMHPPRYPPAALRNLVFGRVRVRMYVNACGDVRDAMVAMSSGNRDLDRAAIHGARKWRLPEAELELDKYKGWLVVPVDFQNPLARRPAPTPTPVPNPTPAPGTK